MRPTASRVREALFSMVGQDLAGWSVLDAFGGTGLLTFEAASRGAAPLTVVERHGPTAARIRQQARALGLDVELIVADAAAVLARAGGAWDLVLLDPPYADDPALWLQRAAPVVRRVLVLEHASGAVPPEVAPGLVLDRRRRYGDTALSLYRPGAP